ncbi:MAG: DNA translocase FtsK 4TM domain-containing protein [Salinivenus sp.]
MAAAESTDAATEGVMSTRRKWEVLGLVLMVLGLLLSLAFITYHPTDDSVVQSTSLGDVVWNAWELQAELQIENALGVIGAKLARLLIPGVLGYGVLILSGALMVWGYAIFRHWALRPLLYPTALAMLVAFVLSSLVGWFGHALQVDLGRWGGALGMGVAGWMQGLFGLPGSLILLLLSVAIMALLVIDHDIQRSVDRVVEALTSIREGIASRWASWQEARPQEDTSSPPATTDTASASPPSASAGAGSSPPRSGPSDGDETPEETEHERSSVTITVPDPAQEKRPVRRNDLFRQTGPGGDTDGPASSGASEPSDAPQESSSDEPPPDPEEATADRPPSLSSPPSLEDESIEPAPSDRPASPEAEDVELTVKERVEEEKADEIERPADTPKQVEYEPPPLDLLDEPTDDDPTINREELEENKRILLDKLNTYNVEIQDISAVVGPTVTRYELTPAPGVKVSRIKSLEDDLAMALAAPSVRMMAPIPGKSAIGVEIPNRDRELVRLREIIGTAKFRDTEMDLPIPMGKTIEGEVQLADLTTMPHLLIAGATGSGKSVGLNSIITGLIYACHPMNLRFVIIDPKKIELQQYTALKTQFVAQPEDVDQTVITDIEEASGVLKSVEKEMEERYELLSDANVRGLKGYNKKFAAGELDPTEGHRHMPYVVVVVDELADLMMSVGDEVEGPISRLAQMARAVGIHLVLATQRPSVDVITGVIKANFPSRIAYEVASMADSRTILDQGGAEGLVGNGDMLFLSGSDLRRLQGPFVSVEEVERVVDFVSDQPGVTPYTLPSLLDAGHGPDETLGVEDTDDKFEEAARVIVRRQQGSVSLLQRKLAVGYTRAARIVDQLEEAGIVGPFNGTKAREVLVEDENELDQLLHGDDEDHSPLPDDE